MMHRCGVAGLFLALPMLLASCDKPSETAVVSERKEPVVVYAAFEDDTALKDLLARYTEESGVLVIVRRGTASDIVTDLVENNISPPADILVTHSVIDVWHAAEEGALRPVVTEAIREQVPSWMRDPDGLWFGTSFRSAVIVHSSLGTDGLDFEELAAERFTGQLCLSSSTVPINRVVISMLIDELGVRPAELVVRGWIRNLAVPILDSEAGVLDSIASGECKAGIVSSAVAARYGLPMYRPAPAFVDVNGIGIGRHARNPDGARVIVDWLHATLPAQDFANPENTHQKNVSLVAWHEEDAIKLAERAQYR